MENNASNTIEREPCCTPLPGIGQAKVENRICRWSFDNVRKNDPSKTSDVGFHLEHSANVHPNGGNNLYTYIRFFYGLETSMIINFREAQERKQVAEKRKQENQLIEQRAVLIAEYLYGKAPLEERQHLHEKIMRLG